MKMKKYVVVGMVGLLVGDVAAETLHVSAESVPHGEYTAVSPTMNIALPNVTATTVSSTSDFDTFTPVEAKIPHDHLVVYPSGLVLPVDGKR